LHVWRSVFINFDMKRKRTVLHRILHAADLPQELDAHRFYVQWYGGDECVIEQHRGILCFEDAVVRLSTDQGVLRIEGETLALDSLTDSCAKITGNIIAVSIEAES